ncbi:MAG: MATE family efflux transporter [Verrucomicrobia bacterium]|nr:MATE family efflux transporter [Verrucomicrobiota bacterium]
MIGTEHRQQVDLYKAVLRVAWPLIVSTGSFTIMMFCDRMFLSWHSAVAIQAVLPAGILAFALTCAFVAIAAYANIFVAQYFGSGDHFGCSRSTAQGIIFALVSYPLILVGVPFGIWFLHAAGHAPDVYGAEKMYFVIVMLGSIAPPLNAAAGSFFTGRGDTRTTMAANVAGSIVNIVLDYMLIFGRWGFPALGLQGAAIATIVAGFVSPIILLALYFSGRMDKQFSTRRSFRYDSRLFWRMVRFGFPSGIHLAVDIAALSFFILLTGRAGGVALAASNIAISINALAFMPLIGFGTAASVLVAQYKGRANIPTAEQVVWTAWRLGTGYAVAVGLTYVLLPEFYISIFAGSGPATIPLSALLPIGRKLLLVMVVWAVMDAGKLIVGHALNGAGDTRFVMAFSAVMAWVFLAGGQWVILVHFRGSILVAWSWTTLYVGLVAFGYMIRFRSGRWKSIEVLEPRPYVEPSRPGSEAIGIAD